MTVEELKIFLRTYGYKLLKKDTATAEALIDWAKTEVKNYCHIRRIPPELEHVVISMAAGEYLYRKKVTGRLSEGQDDPDGFLEFLPTAKGITEGDFKVDFDGASKYSGLSPEVAYDNLINTLRSLSTYKGELTHFRRLKWPRHPMRRRRW